jgi:hypothetical protein
MHNMDDDVKHSTQEPLPSTTTQLQLHPYNLKLMWADNTFTATFTCMISYSIF